MTEIQQITVELIDPTEVVAVTIALGHQGEQGEQGPPGEGGSGLDLSGLTNGQLLARASSTTVSGVSIGSGAGTVAAGDDARLSDARTPTAHASSHVGGGSDAIASAIANGAAGLLSGSDKAKLDGIEAGADVTDDAHVRAALAAATADIGVNSRKLTGLAAGTTAGNALRYEQLFTGTGADLTLTGGLSIAETLTLGAILSPSQITSNQSDYGPSGYATASVFRLSTDASRNLNSLFAASSRRYIQVCNVGSFDIVLKHDDGATGTAAQRILCPGSADLTVKANGSVSLVYDGTSSRWRVLQSRAMVGGSTKQIQYNSGDALAGAANVEIESDHLSLVGVTTAPTGVASRISLAAYRRDADTPLSVLATPVSTEGDAFELQRHVAARKYACLLPAAAAHSFIGYATSGQGTATYAVPALATTSHLTRQRRSTLTGGASSNVSTGYYPAMAWWYLGDAAGRGGFWYRARLLHWPAWQSGMRAFVGLAASTSAFSSPAEPSSNTNIIGIGYDSTDSNLIVMHNDGSGTATRIDLTSDYALSTTIAVDFELKALPGNGGLTYRVWMSDPASAVPAKSGTISSDTPSTSTFLGFREFGANGSTGVAAVLGRASIECFELGAA